MPMINNDLPDAHLVSLCQHTFDFAAVQLERLVNNDPDFFPMYTVQGRWQHGWRGLDELVRRFSGGPALAALPAQRG